MQETGFRKPVEQRFSKTVCACRSPGEHLRVRMPRLPPRPIAEESMGVGRTPVFEAEDQGQQSLAAPAFLLGWMRQLLSIYQHAF